MWITARLAVLTAVAATGLGLAALPAAATTVSSSHTARPQSASATSPLWISRLHTLKTTGGSVAVSPNGSTVFAAGEDEVTPNVLHGVVVAYNATTGAQIWQSKDTANGLFDGIAVSPDGSAVYVTGFGKPAGGKGYQARTIAYNAATGATLWTQTVGKNGFGKSIKVSPDGSTVYVTGNDACGHPVNSCYLTAAYDAATGAALWTQELPNNGQAASIAVAPDGSDVYVTGSAIPKGLADDQYSTVAYNATTGAAVWTASYAAAGTAYAGSVAVSPSGSAVYVTGQIQTKESDSYRTIAYSASSGARMWTQPFSVSKHGSPSSLAVSPDSATVFVTGTVGKGYGSYGTVAYNATTGAQLWQALYRGPAGGDANDLAVSPDGSTVFVTGASYSATSTGQPKSQLQYATLAYDAGTGAQQWLTRTGNVTKGASSAYAIAVSPDGSKLFVTGQDVSNLTTVAYGS